MVAVWKDNTAANWQSRKKIYSQLCDNRMTMVPVSEWLGRRVAESPIWKGAIKAIPNGIDTDVFYPSDQEKERKALGLGLTSKIILCAAAGGTDNPFKNTRLIFEILHYLQTNQKVTIILIGDSTKINYHHQMVDFVTLGQITDRELMRKYYVAADLVFYPTRADTFGLIVAEAMACATPVMASAIGGVNDLIKHDDNGFLFDIDEHPKSIAEKMSILFDNKKRLSALGEKACRTIKDKFNLDIMAQQYMDLYTSAIQKRKKQGVTG